MNKKRNAIIIDWNNRQIFHNNVLFTTLSKVISENLEGYNIQEFRIYNLEYDNLIGSDNLFIEIDLSTNTAHKNMLQGQLECWRTVYLTSTDNDILRIAKDQITLLTDHLKQNGG